MPLDDGYWSPRDIQLKAVEDGDLAAAKAVAKIAVDAYLPPVAGVLPDPSATARGTAEKYESAARLFLRTTTMG